MSTSRPAKKIEEIIYIPSQLSLVPFDGSSACGDDDHFCSILCEQGGFKVHVISLQSLSQADQISAITELISRRKQHGVSMRSIGLIGHELSVISVLTYLAEIALPLTPHRVDIGCVVLIDPPPLQPLHTIQGREKLLERYALSFANITAFKNSLCWARSDDTDETDDTALQELYWDYYRYISRNKEAHHMIVDFLERAKCGGGGAEDADETAAVKDRTEAELALMQQQQQAANERVLPPASSRKSRSKPFGNPIFPRSTVTSSHQLSSSQTPVERRLAHLVGPTPRHASDVAQSLLNRMLVLDSGRIPYDPVPSPTAAVPSSHHDASLTSDFDYFSMLEGLGCDPLDNWGLRAIEEVAELYRADPVISTRDTDYDDDHEGDDEDDMGALITEESEGLHVSSERTGGGASSTAVHRVGVGTHRRIATKLADWFLLLTRFSYL